MFIIIYTTCDLLCFRTLKDISIESMKRRVEKLVEEDEIQYRKINISENACIVALQAKAHRSLTDFATWMKAVSRETGGKRVTSASLLRAEFNGIIYPEDANTFIALKKATDCRARERDSI